MTRGCGYYGSMVDCKSTEQEAMSSEPGQTDTNATGLNHCIYSNKRRASDKHPPHPPPPPTQTQINLNSSLSFRQDVCTFCLPEVTSCSS